MKKDIVPTESKEIIEQPAIVMPAVSPEEAVKAWEAYQALKKKIATPDDIQNIQGKDFYKKSYWRKIATFFNLSVEVIEEKEDTLNPNNTIYHFTQKAIAPNGRFAFGTGSCDQMEKGRKNTVHNARSTAETRAFNRAVSNLVGGGEVSAEEVSSDYKSSSEQAYKDSMITYQQTNTINSLLVKKGKSLSDLHNALEKGFGKEFLKELTAKQADKLIKRLELLDNNSDKEAVGSFKSPDNIEGIEKLDMDEIDKGIETQRMARV